MFDAMNPDEVATRKQQPVALPVLQEAEQYFFTRTGRTDPSPYFFAATYGRPTTRSPRSGVRHRPENGHSQEQSPGMTPENAASSVTQHAGLTPENAGAAHAVRRSPRALAAERPLPAHLSRRGPGLPDLAARRAGRRRPAERCDGQGLGRPQLPELPRGGGQAGHRHGE